VQLIAGAGCDDQQSGARGDYAGSVLILGAFVAFLPPVPPVSAQSHAQRICREHGVIPRSEVYEDCLVHATRAVEWGEPMLARDVARLTVDAQEVCARNGLAPQTPDFCACIDRETQLRGFLR
jgi:hypothetical protein